MESVTQTTSGSSRGAPAAKQAASPRPASSLDQAELTARIRQSLDTQSPRLSSGYQASIRLVDLEGWRVVVKTPHGRGLRGRFHRAMVRKEHRIYQRLSGVEGIPECYGLVDGQHLVLEYIPGGNLRQAVVTDRELFFGRLLETVHQLHRLQVAHGDLKKKDNIMVVGGDRPYLLDFGLAIVRRSGFHPLNRLLFHVATTMDYSAWVKRKYGGYSEQISEQDRRYLRFSWPERVARLFWWPWRLLTTLHRRLIAPRN